MDHDGVILLAKLSERVDDDTAHDSREDEHYEYVVHEVEQEAEEDLEEGECE